MASSWAGLLVTCSLLVVLPGTVAKKQVTCDAIDDMVAGMQGSLPAAICSPNGDCDTVTCQTRSGQIRVEILMCEGPPEVKVSAAAGGCSMSVTFDESASKNVPGGSCTAVLDWDDHTKILGLELQMTYRGVEYAIVPYSEIPIDDSDCPVTDLTDWDRILGLLIALPMALLLVAVVCCGIPLGIWCYGVRGRRQRAAQRFQRLTAVTAVAEDEQV